MARNPSLVAGIGIVGGYAAIGVLAPYAYSGNPNVLPLDNNVVAHCAIPSAPTLSLNPLSWGPHPFGETPHLGIDVLRALALGTRWDLLLLFGVLACSVGIGAFLGGWAGFRGGALDLFLAPLFDGFLAIPPFVLVALALIVLTSPTGGPAAVPERSTAFVLVMLVVLWAPYAHGVRAQARGQARQPYVESARASGAGELRILIRHILPNCSASILAQVPATIFTVLASMGIYQYLGMIIEPSPVCGQGWDPTGWFLLLPSYTFPEWTWTLANGALGVGLGNGGFGTWWAYLIPAVWIAIFVLGVSLLCDGLQGQLSPFERR